MTRSAFLSAILIVVGAAVPGGAHAADAGSCRSALAAIERPPGIEFPEDTRRALLSMASDAIAFAAVGNERACRVRVGQILSVVRRHAPDEGTREAHLHGLQSARPWEARADMLPEGETEIRDVWSPKGEWLGEAERAVAGPAGHPGYLLIARDSWLGLGDDIVAVPLDVVNVTADRRSFVLPVDRQEFAGAPALPDDAALLEAPDWNETAGHYWQQAVLN